MPPSEVRQHSRVSQRSEAGSHACGLARGCRWHAPRSHGSHGSHVVPPALIAAATAPAAADPAAAAAAAAAEARWRAIFAESAESACALFALVAGMGPAKIAKCRDAWRLGASVEQVVDVALSSAMAASVRVLLAELGGRPLPPFARLRRARPYPVAAAAVPGPFTASPYM
mmetsp:Transcript_40929/g.101392  ORF Transcript_40929/g.101392 Transcript_40929/m.101392 type:complete len:171 (+) Transcript_40929:94-606(+)